MTSPYLKRRIRSLDEVLAPAAQPAGATRAPEPDTNARAAALAAQPSADVSATEDCAPS